MDDFQRSTKKLGSDIRVVVADTEHACGGPNMGGPRLNLSDGGGCATAHFAIVQK